MVAVAEMMGPVIAVVVAMMTVTAVAVAVSVVVRVMAPVMVVVMAGAVIVPLRGGRAGDQEERGGDEADETCLHENALSVQDEDSLGPAR